MEQVPAHSLNSDKGEFSFSSSPPLAASMFHAVADSDIEAMVRLYASSCRDTVRSIMVLQQSSSSHQSFQPLPHNKGMCINHVFPFCLKRAPFSSHEI